MDGDDDERENDDDGDGTKKEKGSWRRPASEYMLLRGVNGDSECRSMD